MRFYSFIRRWQRLLSCAKRVIFQCEYVHAFESNLKMADDYVLALSSYSKEERMANHHVKVSNFASPQNFGPIKITSPRNFFVGLFSFLLYTKANHSFSVKIDMSECEREFEECLWEFEQEMREVST